MTLNKRNVLPKLLCQKQYYDYYFLLWQYAGHTYDLFQQFVIDDIVFLALLVSWYLVDQMISFSWPIQEEKKYPAS